MADEDKNVFILNEELLLKIVGENVGDSVEPVLVDSARRLVIHDLLFGRDPDGNERPVQVESTRELAVSAHGEDPSGDIIGLLTDEQRLLRNRPYEPFRSVAAIQLTGAWQTVFTCPANSIAEVETSFGNASVDVGTVSLRVQGRYIYAFANVPLDGVGPRSRFTLSAGELVEALRTDGGTGVSVFCSYKLWSTGDVNTGV